MKPMNHLTRAQRAAVSGPIAASLLAFVLLAKTSAAGAQVNVAVGNGIGAPGATASVTMSLTGGGGNVAQVGFDVVFDVDLLSIQTTDCTIAERLLATHQTLSTFLPQPGRLRLGILHTTFPLETFADGDLATCTFTVDANAPLGAAQLTMENLEVSDASAPPVVLPSTATNGEITIALVTPTPTSTNTPVQPTSTPTATNTTVQPTNTRTNTPVQAATSTPTNTVGAPTNTATATRTRTPSGPTPTNTGGGAAPFSNGGGCNIAASGSADVSPLAWLIVPAALLLGRRRARC